MDYIKFTKDLAAAAKISFNELIKQNKHETFYAFILYTDSDCYTVLPSANSIEKYTEKVAKKGITDPKRMVGYKWYIGEWAYESYGANNFNEVCRNLSTESQAANSNGSFLDFKKNIHACMINALSQIDKEGFFGSNRDNVVLFISSTDYDESLELEDYSAKILNNKEIYDLFINRYINI